MEQYEVQEVIGRGGVGIVLKAHDSRLNIAPELASNPTAQVRVDW